MTAAGNKTNIYISYGLESREKKGQAGRLMCRKRACLVLNAIAYMTCSMDPTKALSPVFPGGVECMQIYAIASIAKHGIAVHSKSEMTFIIHLPRSLSHNANASPVTL